MNDWNKPDSNEALRPWLLIERLTLFQAVMLIYGRDPSHDMTGRPRGYVPIMVALKQAIERGEVPALQTRNEINGDFFSLDHEDLAFVTQADVRQWLRNINRTDAFFFLRNPDQWPDANGKVPTPTDKPLDTRERATLLTIIGALAEAAKLDLAQHNKAGDAVAAMLEAKGVALSGRTIGEHLKKVREAMDSRKVK